jgi:hypothetical protein
VTATGTKKKILLSRQNRIIPGPPPGVQQHDKTFNFPGIISKIILFKEMKVKMQYKATKAY